MIRFDGRLDRLLSRLPRPFFFVACISKNKKEKVENSLDKVMRKNRFTKRELTEF